MARPGGRTARGEDSAVGGERAQGVFLAPLPVVAPVFLVLPLGFSVSLSFSRWNPLGAPSRVGWRPFQDLLTRDDDFLRSLANAFAFAPGFVALGVPLAPGLAFVFSRARGKFVFSRVRGKAVRRSVCDLQQLTDVVAIACLWRFVLDDRSGLVIRLLGRADLRGPDRLGDPAMAMVPVVLVMVWYDAGKNMPIFPAALEAVDQDIHDTAALDDARAWRTLRSIILPIIRPVFVTVTVTSFITGKGFFVLILAMTGGGPRGSTGVIALHACRRAFEDLRRGRASAAAPTLATILGLLALLRFRVPGERA